MSSQPIPVRSLCGQFSWRKCFVGQPIEVAGSGVFGNLVVPFLGIVLRKSRPKIGQLLGRQLDYGSFYSWMVDMAQSFRSSLG